MKKKDRVVLIKKLIKIIYCPQNSQSLLCQMSHASPPDVPLGNCVFSTLGPNSSRLMTGAVFAGREQTQWP